METARNLAKAKMIGIRWNDNTGLTEELSGDQEMEVTVQFNPSSLKVTYANQIQSNDQSGGSSMQYVGKGTSKLALELIFDVSAPGHNNHKDVRQLTRQVAAFMAAQETKASGENNVRYTVPGVRFAWGSFTFDGVMEGMDETLELFSEEGNPLRASVSITLSYQGISIPKKDNASASSAANAGLNFQAGIKPLTAATQGATLQGMTASAGASANWKAVASANNIENPRQIQAGTLLDMNVKLKL